MHKSIWKTFPSSQLLSSPLEQYSRQAERLLKNSLASLHFRWIYIRYLQYIYSCVQYTRVCTRVYTRVGTIYSCVYNKLVCVHYTRVCTYTRMCTIYSCLYKILMYMCTVYTCVYYIHVCVQYTYVCTMFRCVHGNWKIHYVVPIDKHYFLAWYFFNDWGLFSLNTRVVTIAIC